jgi:hypothetical protein
MAAAGLTLRELLASAELTFFRADFDLRARHSVTAKATATPSACDCLTPSTSVSAKDYIFTQIRSDNFETQVAVALPKDRASCPKLTSSLTVGLLPLFSHFARVRVSSEN